MTHTAAPPQALGAQVAHHGAAVTEAAARVERLAQELIGGNPYTVEHAEEQLEWIADALRGAARLFEGVRPYTVTGAPREAARIATARAAASRCRSCGGTGGQHYRNCPIHPH